MRRKSSGGGYSNQRRGRGGQNGNRPRRNYGAAREKYLAQARDALAAGDRVLAENYYQHAEHCYRMLAEEAANNPRQQNNNQKPKSAKSDDTSEKKAANGSANENGDDSGDNDGEGLPAFITSTAFPSMEEEMKKKPVIVQTADEE